MILTVVILAGATLLVGWLLIRAVIIDARMTERLNQLREDAERERRQAEVMAQNRTADDAIDRLDRGDF